MKTATQIANKYFFRANHVPKHGYLSTHKKIESLTFDQKLSCETLMTDDGFKVF